MTDEMPVVSPSLGGAGWPSANTRLAGVVGHPVSHSLSPRLHQAAYRALGVDWAYLAFDVAPGSLEAAVEGARVLGVVGLSVTMPHKALAARLATRRSAVVRRLGVPTRSPSPAVRSPPTTPTAKVSSPTCVRRWHSSLRVAAAV